MRIRLSELKQIIRSEVRRSLYESLPAGGEPTPEGGEPEPTPEKIAAAAAVINDILNNPKALAALDDAIKKQPQPPPANPPAESIVADSKEYYYNNILNSAMRVDEGRISRIIGGALLGTGAAALAAALGLPLAAIGVAPARRLRWAGASWRMSSKSLRANWV